MKRAVFLIALAIASGLCFAQTSVTTLDRALSDAVVYFESRLQSKAKILILNMNTSQTELSEYIIDELAAYMVNNDKLIVVDRRNLQTIRQELNFQMSGDVSDETAQAIGRMLGAQYIISGSLVPLGDIQRLRVQVLAIETAQIAGMINLNVPSNDRVIMALTRGRPAGSSSAGTIAPQAPAAAPRAPTGSTAPAALPANVDTGMKPEKPVPARRGNFEIIPGTQIRLPIDVNRFNAAAKTSLMKLNYNLTSEGTGFVLFSVRGGNWWVQIKLCYWNDEYWFQYVNSHNLSADPERNNIHKNYYEWIKRVEKQLKANYPTAIPANVDNSEKPEKKTSARKGNFEIIPGAQVRLPIDANKFYAAAKLGLERLRYNVDAEGTGFILFTISSGNWWAQIKLCYGFDEYWYEYVNSQNLNANPERDNIHKNYFEGIERVEMQINENYHISVASVDAGAKPEKKIPAKKGNFEITPGRQIRLPIDASRFYAAAKATLELLRYNADAEGTGYILFTVRGGNWWVQIKLCYWNDEYWYEYVNSQNLDANPARDKIHKNYAEWIKRVERQLGVYYYT